MKPTLTRIAQVAIGCTAAIAIALALGLQNAVSAGIITILSLQDTKRATLRAAWARAAAFALATATAWCAFSALGYGVLGFGAYMLVFAALSYGLGLQAQLPISTVLASHYWLAGHMRWWLIGNETVLMAIGSAIGIGLTLLPRDTPQAMQAQQRRIERGLRGYLLDMAALLEGAGDAGSLAASLDAVAQAVADAARRADQLQGNTLFGDTRYYSRYVGMRGQQLAILTRMAQTAATLDTLPPQAAPLAALMREIAATLNEYNDATALLAQLAALLDRYRAGPLPQDRQAFEARATLYRLLLDTEQLLLVKQAFAQGA